MLADREVTVPGGRTGVTRIVGTETAYVAVGDDVQGFPLTEIARLNPEFARDLGFVPHDPRPAVAYGRDPHAWPILPMSSRPTGCMHSWMASDDHFAVCRHCGAGRYRGRGT